MNSLRLFVLAGILICCSAGAEADLILRLAFDDATTSKTVASGSTVLVDMFLDDTDASTPMTADGLNAGGGRITQTAGAATIVNNNATIAGTNTGVQWFSVNTGSGGFAPATTIAPFFQVVGQGETSIHIARFSFTATGAGGDTGTAVQ